VFRLPDRIDANLVPDFGYHFMMGQFASIWEILP
jgi:hypothetical protein